MKRYKLSKWITSTFLFVFMGVIVFGCLEQEEPITPEQALNSQLKAVDKVKLASDIAVIDDSLERWDLTSSVLIEPQGVRYIIDVLGTGVKPTLSSVINVKYVGKFLTDGEEFANNSLVYPLSNLLMGWQTTLPLLPVGTKARLFIPSGLAYGPTGVYNQNTQAYIIQPNANLIFEIELIGVQ